MQVMPGTAAGIAGELGVSSYDIYDPQTNATFGMYYLSQKIARYGLPLGLAAYNWGPSAVDGLLSRHPDVAAMDWPTIVAAYGGEIPEETRGYVTNILAMAARAQPVSSSKCLPTDTGAISAHFNDTNSGYWSAQAGGRHNGTDYNGSQGDPVYAPFALVVEDVQFYSDPGRIGWYVQGRFADGFLFYAGHLGTVAVSVGQAVPACAVLGTIGEVFHST
jgi:murein DD-endopeptidase MepM/ murein hydrolase activator NlpD